MLGPVSLISNTLMLALWVTGLLGPLKGGKGPATGSDWVRWERFGGILLSQEKIVRGRSVRILFHNLQVSSTTDENPFTSPEAHL